MQDPKNETEKSNKATKTALVLKSVPIKFDDVLNNMIPIASLITWHISICISICISKWFV